MRHKKGLLPAYIICFVAGLFGGHHFYLGRPVHGILAVWTGNFLGFGWLVDAAVLPILVRNANWDCAPPARSDGACRRLTCCALPVMVGVMLALIANCYVLMCVPRVLHDLEVVDVDMRVAGTKQNPHDILGVPRGSSTSESYEAYASKVREFKSMKACDSACESAKEELKSVRDWVKGDAWRRSREGEEHAEGFSSRRRRWSDWTDYVGAEWFAVGNAGMEWFTGEASDTGFTREEASGRQSRARSRRRGGAHSERSDL